MPSDWKRSLREEGYAHFPSMTPPDLVSAALVAIERDRRDNTDPGRQLEYDNRSYCPDLRSSREILDLLERSPIRGIMDEAIGWEHLEHTREGQIAIRQAHNHECPLRPTPHLDGLRTPHNGVEVDTILNHTALVGVFLTDVTQEFAGNFTVWPGSHHEYERYFRRWGPGTMKAGMPPNPAGEGAQLLCSAGDVVLAHYQLGHSAAVNISDSDRIAVFFRLWLRGIDERRWECLTNIWTGWRV